MKIKFRLSLIVIAIVVVVSGGLAIILLRQASETSKALSIRGIEFMSSQRAAYWEGREDSNMRVLRTLANIMGDYDQVPAAERRRSRAA